MYSRDTSSKVKFMTYAGEGKIILSAEIKLQILKLSAIEDNSSGFSF